MPRVSAALLALAAGPALSGCGSAAAEAPVPLQDFSVQGRTVTTTVLIGGCEAARLTSRESESTVSLTLRVRSTGHEGQPCPAFIARKHIGTTLREPVGNRSVVDTTNRATLRPPG
ncbi:hypothetical protein ACFW17_14610 [Streptomyces sp. NPDC058961]|uniref:hypothetical protein n=1 Tax=Streptomyces sp. NPDC058961 TaxID=3346680 RepID=UPI0036973F27